MTLEKAVTDARKKDINPTVILANSADQIALEKALEGYTASDGSKGTNFNGIFDKVIYYDGETINVGKKTYNYEGIPTGKVVLVEPNQSKFIEYIKHDLIVDAAGADLSRLVEDQIVGRARRGLFAAVEDASHKATIA
jgi:hypothetical protein